MPRKGRARVVDRLGDGLGHAGNGVEIAPAIGEGAVAGQHHPVGATDHVRVGGDDNVFRPAAAADRIFERLLGRAQIAGAVIDESDGHEAFPGFGKRPTTTSPSGGAAFGNARGTTGRFGPWMAVGGGAEGGFGGGVGSAFVASPRACQP